MHATIASRHETTSTSLPGINRLIWFLLVAHAQDVWGQLSKTEFTVSSTRAFTLKRVAELHSDYVLIFMPQVSAHEEFQTGQVLHPLLT